MPPEPDMPDFDLPPPPGPRDLLVGLSKRQKMALILVCGVLIAIVLYRFVLRPDICDGDDCLTIVANPVVEDTNTKDWTGSYVLLHSTYGIHSNRLSGACLFVESAALNLPPTKDIIPPGGTCSSDDQCTLADPVPPKFADWEGRCDRDAGTCWIRPGPGTPATSMVCNKLQTPGPGVTTPSNIPAFNPAALNDYLTDAAKSSKKIRARVQACLNGKFTPTSADPKPPCGGGKTGNKLEPFGDPVSLDTKP